MFRALLVVICGTALSAAGPLRAQEPNKPPPAPVVVAKAERRTLSPVVWYPATIISRSDARVAAEVTGRLLWVADVGTQVERGDLVARIDDTLIKEDLAEHRAAVLREKARVEFFDKEVKRLIRLAQTNNAARRQLDQAISDRAVARSEMAASQARVQRAKEELRRTEIHAPFRGVITERFQQAGEWAEDGGTVVRLVDDKSLEVQTRVPGAMLAHITEGG
ncbi:MAG: efflux RND transporter periplasmic adaptor subunit, partial [Gammaproteobacteria bacterium]|nr:efflux RND transporter periplasmic adaptor subunit [Gammaproteobacteria bacterium]